MVLFLIPEKLSVFNLSFAILLCCLNTVECIQDRLVNCSDLWDLLWMLLTEASSYCAGHGLEIFLGTL